MKNLLLKVPLKFAFSSLFSQITVMPFPMNFNFYDCSGLQTFLGMYII
jgi:hypothetical protein